jgi:molybdate transport system regulatory protein
MELDGKVWLKQDDKNFLGSGKAKLLEYIEKTGSISKAAKELKMSYKAAWDNVDMMNNLSSFPIVERVTGGKDGGGTRLTPKGKEVLSVFRALEEKYAQFLSSIGENVEDFDLLLQNIRRINMKTSARNQLGGVVKTIKAGAINSELELDIGDGVVITAVITNDAVEALDFKIGEGAFAIIKASWIILAKEKPAKISARNVIKTVVDDIIVGAVNTEVKLKLGAKSLTAVVTNDAQDELGLKAGDEAYAIFKASNVILGA